MDIRMEGFFIALVVIITGLSNCLLNLYLSKLAPLEYGSTALHIQRLFLSCRLMSLVHNSLDQRNTMSQEQMLFVTKTKVSSVAEKLWRTGLLFSLAPHL